MAHVVSTEDNDWRELATEELLQLIDELLHTEKTHLAAAERLQRGHRAWGAITTALSALTGATIMTNISAVAASVFALSAAVISAVLTFIMPQRMAEQHLSAGRQLSAVRVRARHTVNLDMPRLPVESIRDMVGQLAAEKANIDSASPGTNERDYQVARRKIGKGTFDRDR